MHRASSLLRLACGVAALAPLLVSADSQIQAATTTNTADAAAHIDFRIIIPKFIFLQADSANAAVAANGRTLTLQAGTTVKAATPTRIATQSNYAIRAVAHKGIEVQSRCLPHAAIAVGSQVVCTVATP